MNELRVGCFYKGMDELVPGFSIGGLEGRLINGFVSRKVLY